GGGDTAGFDLYLVPGARAESHAEGRIVWSFLDATTPFATLDPALVAGRLDACVTQAYADAILLGMDPAEARSWRAATAAWLAWMVTGIAGCEDPHEEQQRAPWRGWFPSEQETLDQRPLGGGALLLAALSARHDRGTGIFVRELWQMSRQRTWEGLDLRAAPDLWMALETSFELVELEMSEFLAELAVSRYFTGARATGGGLLRDLAPETRVPIRLAIPWSALPAQSVPADPPLEPFGSGYVRVDVRDAPPGSLLRVWLRAEYGVEWSLQAVRLDGRRRELGRMRAPPRRNVPRSYLPVELEPGTETVLLVITNLSSRLPDADGIDENERSFRVILDRGAAGGG
ncbi:MAG: hypothetical protein OEY14_09900, partial [Myxococcales bacterium]|nr:hypothetical protein [Myxococcales bacterium]